LSAASFGFGPPRPYTRRSERLNPPPHPRPLTCQRQLRHSPCHNRGLAKASWLIFRMKMAPQAGLEPATLRLTAGCSAIELLRNAGRTNARGVNINTSDLPRKAQRPDANAARSVWTIDRRFARPPDADRGWRPLGSGRCPCRRRSVCAETCPEIGEIRGTRVAP